MATCRVIRDGNDGAMRWSIVLVVMGEVMIIAVIAISCNVD